MSKPTCQLYLLTPPALDPAGFADTLRAALGAGEVPALQLRLKDVDDDAIRRAVEILQPIAHEHGSAVILNDRPDLAAALGCDGVHVGQEDASYAEARRIMGADRMVGVTCHDSRDLAYDAAEAGADYVAFGAFYETATKQPKSRAPLELLTDWSLSTTVPCVAIGGIDVDNAVPLIEAGADFLAVSAGVWNHPQGPAAAVRRFAELFAAHRAHPA